MKKIVFCIIIILGFLNFHSEDVSAQELCQLGDGDVHFFTNSGEYITDTKIDLYLKTEGKCDSQELTIVVYEYDPCSRSSICNDDNALTMFENNKVKIKTQQGKNAQLKFTGQEEMCDNNSGSKPNCLIYVIIKDNQNKVIYSSREKIINLERDLSEHISELILNQGDSPIRSDDVKRASLKFLGQVNRDGLMLKYCGNFSGIEPLNDVLSAACFGREWSLSSISNADTIDADGNVIPNSNLQAQFIPEKQYIDQGSPCTDTENNEYLEDCYELLAPLPGFSSNLTDGTNNVITKGDRIAIADVKGLQFGDMVNSLFQISLGILMVLAVVMIVIAGVQYMTTESIYGKGDAKGRITNAITGLILALGIFVILNTINPKLLEVNFGVDDVRVKTGQTILSNTDYQKLTGKRTPLEGEVLAQAIRAAKAEGVDYCAIEAILSKETSKLDAGAIGHDENVRDTKSNIVLNSSGKTYSGKIPKGENDVPEGEIDWRYSVGIGLMQVTIFPPKYFDSDYKTNSSKWVPWKNRKIPRKHAQSGYTWTDLLDPEKNIRAGIKILKSKNSNNPLRAFTAYNGSGPAAQRYGREVTGIYNTCCKANEGDPQKKCEGRLTN